MAWWVTSDCCGLFSAFFTVFLTLYAQFVIVKVLLLPWYGWTLHVLFYTFCTVMALWAHSKAQFTDPGAVPMLPLPPIPPEADLVPKTCRKCRAIKPYGASHCSTCNRCVIRMDHHCPWVNNCVAFFNQKYFLQFLFYTACCCIYSGVLLMARFVSCSNNLRQCTVGGLSAALCIINFVEALVFGLFVIIMLFDQLSAIFDPSPHAHTHYKAQSDDRTPQKSKYELLSDVFGEKFSYRWFLPLAHSPKQLLDFERECNKQDIMVVPSTSTTRTPPAFVQQLAPNALNASSARDEYEGRDGGSSQSEDDHEHGDHCDHNHGSGHRHSHSQ